MGCGRNFLADGSKIGWGADYGRMSGRIDGFDRRVFDISSKTVDLHGSLRQLSALETILGTSLSTRKGSQCYDADGS